MQNEFQFVVDGKTYRVTTGVLKNLVEQKTITLDTIVNNGSGGQTVAQALGLFENTAPQEHRPIRAVTESPIPVPNEPLNQQEGTLAPTLALTFGILGFLLSLAGFIGIELLKGLVILVVALSFPACCIGLWFSMKAVGKSGRLPSGSRKATASAIPISIVGVVISGFLAMIWVSVFFPDLLAARRANNVLNAKMVIRRISQIQEEYQAKNPEKNYARTLQEVAALESDEGFRIGEDILTGKAPFSGYIVRGMRVWPKTKSTPANYAVVLTPTQPNGLFRSGDVSLLVTGNGILQESRNHAAFAAQLQESNETGQSDVSPEEPPTRSRRGNSGKK